MIKQIGQWQVLAEQNMLMCGEQEVIVLPKVMTLLLYFIEHADRAISFDELNQAVWPKEVVGDNAIYNLVGQLRKVLGDKASQPRFIVTISKKGYRFIAPVTFVDEAVDDVAEGDKAPAPQRVKAKYKMQALVVCLVLTLTVVFGLNIKQAPQSLIDSAQLPPMAQQHYALAMFHQHKGDIKSQHQAIDYFQQTLAITPTFAPAYIELGFAYVHLASQQNDGDEQAKSVYLKKAQRMIDSLKKWPEALVIDLTVLRGCINSLTAQRPMVEIGPLAPAQPWSVSALLAYAKQLFNQGKTEQAMVLQAQATGQCATCADAYKALATSQMVAMQLAPAFKNYDHYIELSRYEGADPLKFVGFGQLTIDKLALMYRWSIKQRPKQPSLNHLASNERNTLALFYLSLGQQSQAESLMAPQAVLAQRDFYTLYTRAAVAGATGDFATSLAMLQLRHVQYPNNKRFTFSLALAHWMVGDTKQALTLLSEQVFEQSAAQLAKLAQNQPLSDQHFHRWYLYSALLLDSGQSALGEQILTKLLAKLESGLVTQTTQLDMTQVGILALLGKTQQALEHLQSILNAGWVADFNLNWWQLKDDPYLSRLKLLPKFKQLLAEHQQRIDAMTNTIND